MASKRKANDPDIPAENPKRRSGEIILSDGDNTNLPCKCGCNYVNYSRLQAMIRQAVREEFAAAQHQCPRCGGISEEAKQFQLEFSNKLKQEYYTQSKILAERDAPVGIVLLDVRSRSIVTEGPMSSTEIEICVLPGDFGSDYYHKNWRREEFNANIIVRPREGRKEALLKGEDKAVTLKDGVAFIPNIEFTDISKCNRTGTFRLAAKSKDANVREAISQPFVVKDKRGESIMKHAQPSLDSKLWRLRHIKKGGNVHKQLLDDGIETVKDFMRLLTTNPSSLKEKFGNISRNKWETIIENASACVIDDNVHYCYRATERRLLLVLNSIYQVVKVSFDNGQTYRSPETFTSADKRLVEVAKKEAYENEKDFVELLADLEELGTRQVGQSSNGGAPQQDDLIPAAATQQVQGYEWDQLCGSEINYSPSSLSLLDYLLSTSSVLEADSSCPLHRLVHFDEPPSTPAGRKSKWTKIRAALKWLFLRTPLCR